MILTIAQGVGRLGVGGEMRKLLAGLAIVGALSIGAPSQASEPSLWSRYAKSQGTSQVHTIRIRTDCVSAEDSAAHLRLIQYGNGIAVYGCAHRGY